MRMREAARNCPFPGLPMPDTQACRPGGRLEMALAAAASVTYLSLRTRLLTEIFSSGLTALVVLTTRVPL